MCLICVEVAKGKMTVSEVKRALPEMINGDIPAADREHYKELQKASEEELLKMAKQYKKSE